MIAFYKDPSFFDRSLTATASRQGVSLDQYKASFLEGTDALIKNEKDDFTHMALYETNAFIQAPDEISINLLPSEPLPVSSLISLINLHYNHYRYYDPQLGRYITSDPIGLEGGLNTYGYANQNPLYWVDTDGLLPKKNMSLIREKLKEVGQAETKLTEEENEALALRKNIIEITVVRVEGQGEVVSLLGAEEYLACCYLVYLRASVLPVRCLVIFAVLLSFHIQDKMGFLIFVKKQSLHAKIQFLPLRLFRKR